MYEISSLNRLVHDARQHAGQTQREFANRVGTSQSAIAKLEMGDANPTVDTLARCADAAGLALQLTLVPRPVTDVVWNGVKPVFELVTALGHRPTRERVAVDDVGTAPGP